MVTLRNHTEHLLWLKILQIVSSVDSLGDLCDDRKTERVVRKKLLEARGGMDAYKNMDPAEIRK